LREFAVEKLKEREWGVRGRLGDWGTGWRGDGVKFCKMGVIFLKNVWLRWKTARKSKPMKI
jgi:hypothetical protein